MNIGELIKVHLPGEAPWAECVAIHDDGTWEGRIDNTLVSDLHSFKFNDIVRFHVGPVGGINYWVPTPNL